MLSKEDDIKFGDLREKVQTQIKGQSFPLRTLYILQILTTADFPVYRRQPNDKSEDDVIKRKMSVSYISNLAKRLLNLFIQND